MLIIVGFKWTHVESKQTVNLSFICFLKNITILGIKYQYDIVDESIMIHTPNGQAHIHVNGRCEVAIHWKQWSLCSPTWRRTNYKKIVCARHKEQFEGTFSFLQKLFVLWRTTLIHLVNYFNSQRWTRPQPAWHSGPWQHLLLPGCQITTTVYRPSSNWTKLKQKHFPILDTRMHWHRHTDTLFALVYICKCTPHEHTHSLTLSNTHIHRDAVTKILTQDI